jgi:hypothetical protein
MFGTVLGTSAVAAGASWVLGSLVTQVLSSNLYAFGRQWLVGDGAAELNAAIQTAATEGKVSPATMEQLQRTLANYSILEDELKRTVAKFKAQDEKDVITMSVSDLQKLVNIMNQLELDEDVVQQQTGVAVNGARRESRRGMVNQMMDIIGSTESNIMKKYDKKHHHQQQQQQQQQQKKHRVQHAAENNENVNPRLHGLLMKAGRR